MIDEPSLETDQCFQAFQIEVEQISDRLIQQLAISLFSNWLSRIIVRMGVEVGSA